MIKSVGWDDYTMIGTLLIYVAFLGCEIGGWRYGTGRRLKDLERDNAQQALMVCSQTLHTSDRTSLTTPVLVALRSLLLPRNITAQSLRRTLPPPHHREALTDLDHPIFHGRQRCLRPLLDHHHHQPMQARLLLVGPQPGPQRHLHQRHRLHHLRLRHFRP